MVSYGIGNNADPDDDNDKYPDVIEIYANTSPLDETEFPFVDFSDAINDMINEETELDSIESNIKLWLDSSNINSTNNAFINANSTINIWVDLSGSANIPSQSINENMPIFIENALNGLDGIAFNQSSNQFFELIYDTSLNPNNLTIFTVAKTTAQTSTGSIISSVDTGQSTGYSLLANGDNNELQLQVGNNTGYNTNNSILSTLTDAFILVGQNTSSTSTLYTNGVLNGENSYNYTQNNTEPTRIGAGSDTINSPASYFDGTIFEVIVIDSILTNQERIQINYYLSKKWD